MCAIQFAAGPIGCHNLAHLKNDLEVKYKPRKEMFLAHSLSRANIKSPQSTADLDLAEDINVTVHILLHDSASSPNTLVDLEATADSDVTLSQLKELVRFGCLKDVTKLYADHMALLEHHR